MSVPHTPSFRSATVLPVGFARFWQAFRQNRRGYISLWLFGMLFALTLLAEVIANEKPIVISYRGEWYFPAFVRYAETTFGGVFETEPAYRSPYMQALIEQAGGHMVWPPIPFDYTTINYRLDVPAPSAPSLMNWLGTDDQGRDVLARLIYGFRLSVLFAMALTTGSVLLGILAGAVQGYFGGLTDLLGQRLTEIWSGMPVLFLLIILASVVEPNFWWLLCLMLLFNWMPLSSVVRAEFLRVRNFDFVRAARALGVSESRILLRHVLPNALVATVTYLPFKLSAAIVTLASLDFLGFGLPPGSPSLGELLSQAKANPHATWLGLTSFLVMAISLSLLVFIGEAVRNALNPQLHRR